MSLPVRTTVEDINAVCKYLMAKPIGATLAEARAVVNRKHLDGRKLSALRFWGLIEDENNRFKLTDLGRRSVENSASLQSEVFREVIRGIEPYYSIVERVSFNSEESISATEAARHWYENFKGQVSDSEKTLNLQAICFFHLAQSADLGTLTIGRKGQPTRFSFNSEVVSKFFESVSNDVQLALQKEEPTEVTDSVYSHKETYIPSGEPETNDDIVLTNQDRVFITHGRNHKLIEQLKEIVAFGKYEAVTASEEDSAQEPDFRTIVEAMKTCKAAIIHVSSDATLRTNALFEIGAAMALFGDKTIILIEGETTLPINLQHHFQCRYEGNELDMLAFMDLLKAFNIFEKETERQ